MALPYHHGLRMNRSSAANIMQDAVAEFGFVGGRGATGFGIPTRPLQMVARS
jgi:hypothetical protein